MVDNRSSDLRADMFFMLVSAGVFAYFGFGSSWVHQYTTDTPPQWIPMVAVLEWALKGGAIGCGLAAVLAFMRLTAGDWLYAIVGLITAVLFVAVAIWEWTNPRGLYSGVPAILLVIFAAWNGFGSLASLRELLGSRRSQSSHGASA